MKVSYPEPSKYKFTFIDLFAGIGGMRIAFQEAGGKCVFTSEWDKYAQMTYERIQWVENMVLKMKRKERFFLR